ncbi:MAG: hypothetical protein IJ329_01420 [Clostridia bacterium]|nr:hypothetical protein [Clostridia bacterium]
MFCTHCGKEISENAYVCTGCGCLVQQEEPKTKAKIKTEEADTDKGLKLAKMFMIATMAFVGLAFIFTVIYFTSFYVDYYYSSYTQTYSYFYLWGDYDFAICAIIFSVCAFGLGTTQFTVMLIKEKKLSTLKLLSVIVFIMALASFVAALTLIN